MSGIAARSSRAGTRPSSCRRRLRSIVPADRALCLLLLTATGACGDHAVVTTRALTRYPAAEAWTPGQTCSDLGALRVCWRGSEPTVAPRVLPSAPVPPQGWRCGGEGRERVCEDRSRNASGFDCGTQRCLQARPRMPDDGEWECVEISGVVFCHSRGEGAGMQAGPSDLGWLCGPRRGAAAPGERVCVDFDADRPSGAPLMAQRCSFELHFGTPQRSCTAAPTLRVGSPCSAASSCPDGSRCSAGACLPERPEPGCFFDKDCGDDHARCVFGSCKGA